MHYRMHANPPAAEMPWSFSPEEVGILRKYEMMIILSPSVDERTVAPTMEKMLKVVKADGGTVENLDIWGKRRFAYEINKHTEGIYVVVDMTTSPAQAQELDRQLNLSEDVLRTKLMRPEGK